MVMRFCTPLFAELDFGSFIFFVGLAVIAIVFIVNFSRLNAQVEVPSKAPFNSDESLLKEALVDGRYKRIQPTMLIFSKIQTGMTIKEVMNIASVPTCIDMEQEMLGYKDIIASWHSVDDNFAVMTIHFQNGAVINKSQIGLR